MKQKRQHYLDEEEKTLIETYENSETEPVDNASEMKAMAIKAAKNYLEKNKNINIRLSQSDIQKIKAKAEESGLPYQTLIAALLHQYANDKIKPTL